MHVTVDRLGRLVIPKALRVAPDTQLELIPDGSGLRIEPVQQRVRPMETRGGLLVLGRVEGAMLTDDVVRRLRDDLRR